jgi:hypothetical protein
VLVKLVGILLIIVGGWVALGTLFPLIGSIFMLAIVSVKLLIAIGIAYLGYRLITKEDEY